MIRNTTNQSHSGIILFSLSANTLSVHMHTSRIYPCSICRAQLRDADVWKAVVIVVIEQHDDLFALTMNGYRVFALMRYPATPVRPLPPLAFAPTGSTRAGLWRDASRFAGFPCRCTPARYFTQPHRPRQSMMR